MSVRGAARRSGMTTPWAPAASDGADDGAQVVGVFDAVEQDDDATVAGWIGVSENVFERAGGACGDDGDDALVIFGVGEAVELAAVFEADGDALFSCELNNFFYAGVLAAFGDNNAVDGALGLKGFADGVDAGEAVDGRHARNSLQKMSQSRAAQNSRMRVRADFTGAANWSGAASSRRRTTRSSWPSPARPASARRSG